jgi:predicted nuclease with TOPRIM domain
LLKRAFIDAFNSLIENKDEIIKGYEEIIHTLTDTSVLDKETEKLQSESDILRGLIKKCVDENATIALEQTEYQRQYFALVNRHEEVQNRLEGLSSQIDIRRANRENIENFIKILQCNGDLLINFDEELWFATVESLIVHNEREFIFTFKDGTKLIWKIL